MNPKDGAVVVVEPELLTLAEAAQLCAVGRRTFWRWANCGIAPAPVRLGDGRRRTTRWSRRELLEWIAARCPRREGEDGQ